MKADDLYKAYNNAVEYIGKIGKPQYHFSKDDLGKLVHCDVSTEICYQHSSGSQNYWKNSDFDKALSKVIAADFNNLASKALEIMLEDANIELLKEKQDLLERLKKIQDIENKGKT